MWMMAFAGGLRQEQRLCTNLQGTSLCPRFQSDTLTAENEINPFLKPLYRQVLSPSLEWIDGVVTLVSLPVLLAGFDAHSFAEFKEELLQVFDECVFDIGFSHHILWIQARI